MKCIIAREIDGVNVCWTVGDAEDEFRNDFLPIMMGMHGYYSGYIVSDDTPLGYVEEMDSLFPTDEYPHMVQDI